MDPPPHAPAGAGAGAGGAAAVNASNNGWQPVVTRGALLRAQIGMAAGAAAGAAFALFAFTIRPATFPNLPAYCDTTAREIVKLRHRAWLLLLSASAQAAAATAALAVAPPTRAGRFFAVVANLLALVTVAHITQAVLSAIFATGGVCLTTHLGTAELIVHGILTHVFLFAILLLWAVGQ